MNLSNSPSPCNAKLAAIVAVSTDLIIGDIDGSLPWHIPSELKYFKEKTVGRPVIMGRKTYNSLPFPLRNRAIIVLSKNPSRVKNVHSNVHVVSTPVEAIAIAQALAATLLSDEIIVAGGAKIYELFSTLVDKLYMTCVDVEAIHAVALPVSFPAELYNLKNDWVLSHAESVEKVKGNAVEPDIPGYTKYCYLRRQQSLGI